ncbi:MAG: glycosyltransferase family 2 protein [Bacteroidetes bacterium]|nr:MAG: glycosyltransferase family 2 protein [Bacteroidota bacterium]
MKVSIVIRCLNEEQHIGKLLAGIMAQTKKDVEIIVVDSGSRDATLQIARQFPVKIIQIKPEDFSFGYALNVGCRAATGDILLFASAHVYPVYNDWLELMCKPFEEDEQVAVVYGKQRGDHRNKYSEHQVFAKWFPDESNPNQKHPFCNNANCAIRRRLWEMQPYDETLTGLEDLDWAKKIQEKGYKIVYQGEAVIIHVHEEKWKNVFNRYRREAIAYRLIMKNETFNFFTFIRLLTKNWWGDYRQALKDGVFVREFFSIFMFRLMQFWGTYRGYKQSYLMDNHLRERFYYPKGYLVRAPKTEPRQTRKIDYSGLEMKDKPR